MKTTCPSCATSFRVTPEQLAARAGKVRCGKCQTVFNANDRLLDKNSTPPPSTPPPPSPPPADHVVDVLPTTVAATPAPVLHEESTPEHPVQDILVTEEPWIASAALAEPLPEAEAQEFARLTSDLIIPRETTEIPGYSKWTEGSISSSTMQSPSGKAAKWPFLLVAVVLGLILVVQMIFHFRSPLAVAVPALRPLLETLSHRLGADIPLPRHAELISIETSDLQVDPKRTSLLALQATLRNRAAHEQAYPVLQLALTDTQDSVIARRVFWPGEYLSPQDDVTPQVFAANAEISVRLWIETKDITAAGYRLYAFYP